MPSFDIQPIERFAGKSTAIKRPTEIACFSYDKERKFRLDDSSLSYYWPPRLGADLCEGFETFQKYDDTADEHLDGLLKTIMAMEQEQGKRTEVDIVTWRGMMTKIMTAPYEMFDGFDMHATRFQDTIYIEENKPEKNQARAQAHHNLHRRNPQAASDEMMQYWGYKFETLSVLPDCWNAVSRETIENRETEVVNNYAQYCSIVRTGMGNTSLVLGGEVDAIWDQKPDDKEQPINWVELKTAQVVASDRDQLKFERKLLRYWAQSFLLGVPKIIVGFRTREGILSRLEELQTQKIPGTVLRGGKASWNGNLCINFAATFLEFLKQTVTSEGVWRIHRRAKSPTIEVFKIEEAGYGSIIEPEFAAWRKKLVTKEVLGMLA